MDSDIDSELCLKLEFSFEYPEIGQTIDRHSAIRDDIPNYDQVLIPERETSIRSMERSTEEGTKTNLLCPGCREDQPNQSAHMEYPDGCLCDRSRSQSSSSSSPLPQLKKKRKNRNRSLSAKRRVYRNWTNSFDSDSSAEEDSEEYNYYREMSDSDQDEPNFSEDYIDPNFLED